MSGVVRCIGPGAVRSFVWLSRSSSSPPFSNEPYVPSLIGTCRSSLHGFKQAVSRIGDVVRDNRGRGRRGISTPRVPVSCLVLQWPWGGGGEMWPMTISGLQPGRASLSHPPNRTRPDSAPRSPHRGLHTESPPNRITQLKTKATQLRSPLMNYVRKSCPSLRKYSVVLDDRQNKVEDSVDCSLNVLRCLSVQSRTTGLRNGTPL